MDTKMFLCMMILLVGVDIGYGCFTCKHLRAYKTTSGMYTIYLPSGYHKVFCEMGINGGGYTFISNSMLPKLTSADLKCLFTRKTDVLLRLSKPDGTQPFTVITQYRNTGGLKIYLSSHPGTERPLNYGLSPYLYLDTLPGSSNVLHRTEGIKSNGVPVTFRNCDRNDRSYFAFMSNPHEKTPSRYHIGNLVYERQGVAVKWRASAKRPHSGRRMPLENFFFTEIHYGGCGTYTSSDRWLSSRHPALGTAIGLR